MSQRKRKMKAARLMRARPEPLVLVVDGSAARMAATLATFRTSKLSLELIVEDATRAFMELEAVLRPCPPPVSGTASHPYRNYDRGGPTGASPVTVTNDTDIPIRVYTSEEARDDRDE